MDIPTLHPPALRPGNTIAIIAPASTIEKRDTLDASIATLGRLGFKVRCDERILQSKRYLAGEDEARAEELHRNFEDPEVRAVLALRGGYGCARIIPFIDEKRLRPHCKVFMGFSDLATLHIYFRRRFGWVTLHGPMANSTQLAALGPAEEQNLISLWTDPDYLPNLAFPALETWFPGVAEGRLAGGCLAVILSSLGTPYEIKTAGKILFLEDVGEEPYRLDRMLTQLKLAGKLKGVAGFILGTFHNCAPSSGQYTAEETLREILGELEVPVLANFPAGHGPENWAFPLGVRVRLDADQRRVEFLEPLVR